MDYSNIFVKNLDPDINSFFLEETFSQVGSVSKNLVRLNVALAEFTWDSLVG